MIKNTSQNIVKTVIISAIITEIETKQYMEA